MKTCWLITILLTCITSGYSQDTTVQTIKVRKTGNTDLELSKNCYFCLAERKGDNLILFGEINKEFIEGAYFKRATEFYTSEDMKILGFRVYYYGIRSEVTSWTVKRNCFPRNATAVISQCRKWGTVFV